MTAVCKAAAAAGATTPAAPTVAGDAPASSGKEAGDGDDRAGEEAGGAGDPEAEGAGAVAAAVPDNLDDLSTVAKFTRTSGGPAKALKRYIAGFSAGNVGDQLGSQPPCRSYRYLLCISEFAQLEERLNKARSKQEISAAFAFYKPFKSAYTDLTSMARAAANRLTAALERVRRDQSEDLTHATRVSKQAAKKKAPAPMPKQNTLDAITGTGIAKDLKSVALVAGEKHPANLVCDLPMVLRVDPKQPIVQAGADMVKATIAFEKRFATSVEYADPGRVQRKFSKEVADDVVKFFGEMLPEKYLLGQQGLAENLQQALVPIMFAIAKNRETCSAETGHLATMRLMLHGTRKVLLASTAHLWKYLAEELKMPMVNAKKIYAWFKSATPENLKNFTLAFPEEEVLYNGTVGVHDVLYTPPGWTFMERVANSDVVGVKCQVLSANHNTSIAELHRLVLASMETNTLLQSAVDALVLKDG
jgi:hypothetical protein